MTEWRLLQQELWYGSAEQLADLVMTIRWYASVTTGGRTGVNMPGSITVWNRYTAPRYSLPTHQVQLVLAAMPSMACRRKDDMHCAVSPGNMTVAAEIVIKDSMVCEYQHISNSFDCFIKLSAGVAGQ